MSVYVSVDLKRKIRERFKNRCAYCQTAEFLTATTFEFEHIQPLAAGGETTFENLCLACPSCNRHKSDRQFVQDSQTGMKVPLFHPQRQVWIEHFDWSEHGAEIKGLTATGQVTCDLLQMNRPAIVRARSLWIKLGEHPPSLGESA